MHPIFLHNVFYFAIHATRLCIWCHIPPLGYVKDTKSSAPASELSCLYMNEYEIYVSLISKLFTPHHNNFGTFRPKGSLFPRVADPKSKSFTIIYPLQGYVPRPFILISLSPWGDLIQVLPAVSFRKHKRYRLSYRGWALGTIKQFLFYPLFTKVSGQCALLTICYS